jgi:hypothetical protein
LPPYAHVLRTNGPHSAAAGPTIVAIIPIIPIVTITIIVTIVIIGGGGGGGALIIVELCCAIARSIDCLLLQLDRRRRRLR